MSHLTQRANPAICSSPRDHCPVDSLDLKKLAQENKIASLLGQKSHNPLPTTGMANLFTDSPSPTSCPSCCHKDCRILSLCPSPQTLLTQQGLQEPLVPKSQCFSKCRLTALGSDIAGNGPLPWLFSEQLLSFCFVVVAFYLFYTLFFM